MAEYIEREALINSFRSCGASKDLIDSIVYRINLQEAADVAPVRYGEWGTHSDRPDSLICSVCNCGFDMWKHDPHNFCSNCGAKMGEEIRE